MKTISTIIILLIFSACSTCYECTMYDRNGIEIKVGDSVRDQEGSGLVIMHPDSTIGVRFAPDVITDVNGCFMTVIKRK